LIEWLQGVRVAWRGGDEINCELRSIRDHHR
jgi:hypothetical protein